MSSSACWQWGRACAKAQARGHRSPDKPPLKLPDRARSGVIWAHSCAAGAAYGEEEMKYAQQDQAE